VMFGKAPTRTGVTSCAHPVIDSIKDKRKTRSRIADLDDRVKP
jgi:hypothetical protein